MPKIRLELMREYARTISDALRIALHIGDDPCNTGMFSYISYEGQLGGARMGIGKVEHHR